MQTNSNSQIPLSPTDNVFLGRGAYAVEFLFHFSYELDTDRLQAAIERTAKTFWPANARLQHDNETSWCFVRSDRPVNFEILPAANRDPNFEQPSDLAKFTESMNSAPNEPLLKIRYAKIPSGSVLVVNISHAVVDGYSYFFFLSALATNYRCKFFSSGYWKMKFLKPDFDRSKLRRFSNESSSEIDQKNFDQLYLRTGLVLAEERGSPTLGASKWEFVRFAQAQLSEEVEKASKKEETRLSKHDIVSAILWKKIAEEWHSTNDQLEFSSAFDFRRVHPALSPMFFGNAIRATALRLSRDEIQSHTLSQLAKKIRKATDSIDLAAVLDALKVLEYARTHQPAEFFQRLHVSHPRHGLLVTNLSRIPVKNFDFGKGEPRRVMPLTPAPRSAILLADGADIVARLSHPS